MRSLECGLDPHGYRLRYELGRLSVSLETRLLPVDATILRVALAAQQIRLLPAALRPTDEDRACTTLLVGAFRTARDALSLPR